MEERRRVCSIVAGSHAREQVICVDRWFLTGASPIGNFVILGKIYTFNLLDVQHE